MSDVEYLRDHLTACTEANKKLLACVQDVNIDDMKTYGRKHRGLKLLNKLLTVWESVSETLMLTYRSANTLPDSESLRHIRNECVRERVAVNKTETDIRRKLNLLNSRGV